MAPLAGLDAPSLEDARGSWLNELLPALQRLDRLLERAVEVAQSAYSTSTGTDTYPGLYIGPDEVQRLLAREPAGFSFQAAGQAAADNQLEGIDDDSRLGWLRQTFQLSSFDPDLVLITLPAELD